VEAVSPDKEHEPVVFRVWNKGGEVLALFPRIPADVHGLFCLSYERVGEHGAASVPVVIPRTRPAHESEYADLLRYLQEKRGYRLRVMRRVTPRDVEIRRRVARSEAPPCN